MFRDANAGFANKTLGKTNVCSEYIHSVVHSHNLRPVAQETSELRQSKFQNITIRLTPILFTVVTAKTVYGLSFLEVRSAFVAYTDRLRRSLSDYDNVFNRSAAEVEARGSGGCPAVWTSIVTEMSALFIDNSTTPSQCNDDARAAIRAAFHDCGTWDKSQGSTGGCDGSLIVAGEAFGRPENNGLQGISNKLLVMQQKYTTPSNPFSVADMLQMATSVATLMCLGGPKVPTFVGRKDSAAPKPHDKLPDAHGSGDSLFALFQAKGFTANELAALLGAHSASKAFNQPDIVFGTSKDDTPGIWDVHYYSNTLKPVVGMASFQADFNLASYPVVGKEFNGFVNSAGKWNSAYANSMAKMALLGVPGGRNNLIDCTGVLPRGTSIKRDIKAAPINDRVR
ncbi:heme peroxidase [Rhexocercosporidium sp. MPI-PUGE-AT-0058]|nr:heme peroxidase [Rhexocercosporidium sp. MPI-PUGE-AT-0058]